MNGLMALVIAGGLTAIVVALAIWIMKACDECNHSYERIDNCNNKRMILVCSKCGKIKRLRK